MIFSLRSVCVAFLPKVGRGKVPVYSWLSSLPTQQYFVGAEFRALFSLIVLLWENTVT